MAAAERKRVRRKSAGAGVNSPSRLAGLAERKRKEKGDSEEEIQKMVPGGLSRAYVQSKLHEERIRTSGLRPPDDFEGDMPKLPDDVASVTHDELSQLLVDFQSALSTATWQASKAYIRADIMEDIASYLADNVILASSQSNDAKRKAEANTDEQVLFFRSQQKIAYHDYVRYRDLAADFAGKVKVVSRVGGFKDDDERGSDANARPKLSNARKKSSKRHRSTKGD